MAKRDSEREIQSFSKKVMALQRGLSLSMLTPSDNRLLVGAEPDVDPRHIAAEATYGHMIHPCKIEIVILQFEIPIKILKK